jgi:two-component system, LytTR family, sensor kinase
MERPTAQSVPGSEVLVRAAAYVAFWLLVSVAFAGQTYLTQYKVGNPVGWTFAFGRSLADWATFGVLAYPAHRFALRFPFGSGPWRLLGPLHFAAAVVFALGWVFLRAAAATLVEGASYRETVRYALVATLAFNMLVYGVIAVVANAMRFYSRLRERELRGLELEKRLAEARLLALRAQLNPHFLFNALHGVSALMYRDVDAADTMLVKLSDLLRHALNRPEGQLTTLGDELAFLDRYLEVESIRFGGRLRVVRDISPEVAEALLPTLILQPLVENALKHGLEPKVGGGTITLRAHPTGGGRCLLEVEDDGRGMAPGRSLEGGIGTSNSRARLRELYGAAAEMTSRPGAGGGLCVSITLPLRLRESGDGGKSRGGK